MKFKREYFIAWRGEVQKGKGQEGNHYWRCNKINRKEIEEIREFIEKDTGIKNFVITNIIKLDK